MKIEQFKDEIPLVRLKQELTGRDVVIELLLIDNAPDQLAASEQLYLERYPEREPEDSEIRDFAAIHYTPLLQVWNKGRAGVMPNAEVGPEDVLKSAVRTIMFQTRIREIRLVQAPRERGSLELVEIENEGGISLTFPLEFKTKEGATCATIVENPFTRRREYAIRFYNAVLVISLA